jgi:hypothetical protein
MRDLIRFASFRLAEHFVGSKAVGNIEKFWPLESEPKKVKLPTAEDKRRILNRFKKDK